jgi:hypothetical protein
MADSPKTLDEALAVLQADPPVLTKNKSGQVGQQKTRYADLVQVNTVVMPRLNALGIIYKTKPTLRTEEPRFVLAYSLTHIPSGTSEAGEYPLKLSENPMQMGSAITYARRYVLLAITGIAAEDEDDDGQAASGRATAQRAARPAARRPAAAPTERTTQRAAAPPLPTDGPQPYTAAQRAKLMAGFGQVGIEDRSERLDVVSRLIGREIASANELTSIEARRVIDALEKAAASDNPMLRLAELAPPDADPAGDPPPDPAEG